MKKLNNTILLTVLLLLLAIGNVKASAAEAIAQGEGRPVVRLGDTSALSTLFVSVSESVGAELSPKILYEQLGGAVCEIQSLDIWGNCLARGSAVVLNSEWGQQLLSSSIIKQYRRDRQLDPNVRLLRVVGKMESDLTLDDSGHWSLLVTNWHVLELGEQIVVLSDGAQVAEGIVILAVDEKRDLALVLARGPAALQSSVVVDGSDLEIGSRVYAIGNPLGLSRTFSDGMVSGRREIDGLEYIQFTSAIGPGSSGGGLFDSTGRLCGIITATVEGGQNVNFAIPVGKVLLSLDKSMGPKEPNFGFMFPCHLEAEIEFLRAMEVVEHGLKVGLYNEVETRHIARVVEINRHYFEDIEAGRLELLNQPKSRLQDEITELEGLRATLAGNNELLALVCFMQGGRFHNLFTTSINQVRVNPGSADPYKLFALSDQALKRYSLSLDARPEFTPALLELLHSDHGLDAATRPKMLESIRHARERFPRDPNLLAEEGRFLEFLGEKSAAESLLKKAVDMHPFNLRTSAYYCLFLLRSQRDAEAAEIVRTMQPAWKANRQQRKQLKGNPFYVHLENDFFGLVYLNATSPELSSHSQQTIQALSKDFSKSPTPTPSAPSIPRHGIIPGDREELTLPGGVKMAMRWIPAGSFTMGSPSNELGGRGDDENQVSVRLSQGFWMAETEVTQAQWRAVMGTDPSYFAGDTLPVEQVSWNDAVEFCQSLSISTGMTVALPTEAQWEYACRAGTTTRFYSGSSDGDLGSVGWYGSNSGNMTNPVGQKAANAWGLRDMHGNVCEWCADWYVSWLPGGPDPTGPFTGSRRVLRGADWRTSYAPLCRSAARYYLDPTYRGNSVGFRPVLTVQ